MPASTAAHTAIKRQFRSLGRPISLGNPKKKRCERFRCNHCSWEGSAASPTRLQEHLNACAKYQKSLKADKPPSTPSIKPDESISESSKAQQKITNRVDHIPKLLRDSIDYAAAAAIISNGRAFGLFESRRFHRFFHLLRPGWQPITGVQVNNRLQDVYTEVREAVLEIIRGADHINVIFDASDNVSHQRIVNLSVKVPDGPAFYWKTFDTGDQQHTAENWVDLLWPELLVISDNNLLKINSICTDTEATMRAVHNLLQAKDKLKHVNFSLCDSHGLSF